MWRRWNKWSLVFIAIFSRFEIAHGYEDDDLLCRPGWSPELYHQQVLQQQYQQRASYADYQNSQMYGSANEQRAAEFIRAARRARFEKAARKREELIAKRKAENAKQILPSQNSNVALGSTP